RPGAAIKAPKSNSPKAASGCSDVSPVTLTSQPVFIGMTSAHASKSWIPSSTHETPKRQSSFSVDRLSSKGFLSAFMSWAGVFTSDYFHDTRGFTRLNGENQAEVLR